MYTLSYKKRGNKIVVILEIETLGVTHLGKANTPLLNQKRRKNV